MIEITPKEYLGNGKVGAQLQPNIDGSIRTAKNFGEIFNYTNEKFSNLLVK